MHKSKAQINSVVMQLQHNLSTYKMAGCIKKSTEIMQIMNRIVSMPELQKTMMMMAREMEKAGLIEEVVEETMNLDDDIEDEEVEEEVDKVLTELDLEVATATPGVPGKEKPMRQKQPEDTTAEDDDLLARYEKIKT
eukprot:TRINITY_DN1934_c0_g5_i2.p1 TRINITY_DN1934_c0_g5~~TRINITY_DN1934_c0_g5_i2.p1  ORF type:complete len:137 (+),score=37.10 TRINITY_DN1934_c0_g5_i2:327-737(+)